MDRKAGKRVVNDSFISARVNEQKKTKPAIEWNIDNMITILANA